MEKKTVLSPELLETYPHAVHQKGSPLSNCFVFIDGTVRPICRPRENQRIVYNGHKRINAYKFQSVALPNGVIANIYGPLGNSIITKYIDRGTVMLSPILIYTLLLLYRGKET